MAEPTFIIIGSGKCGTTALADVFRFHPQIYVSVPKEPNFFSDDDQYEKGLDWYRQLFEPGSAARARGEASGRYSCLEVFPATARRMAACVPECKLIYIVRHPFERIESLWMENASQGLSWVLPFGESLRKQREVYIDSTNYLRQIDRYREYYSDEQIRIVFYEDLFGENSSVLASLYEFLGVDPHLGKPVIDEVVNPSNGKLVDSSVLLTMRTVPMLRSLSALMPEQLRMLIKKVLPRERVVTRPDWSEESRALVRDTLERDLAEFLRRYGKPSDFWGVDDW